jgi:hypothetical protein
MADFIGLRAGVLDDQAIKGPAGSWIDQLLVW